MSGKKVRKVGDYQIIDELGEGLTSCVYKAIKKNSDWGVQQTVALKILKSREQVQALAQEISLLSSLDSQHCVKMLGWIENANHPAIVLEFLDGVSLHEIIKFIPLPPPLIDEIVAQIQAGLLDLHRHHLRHGDLSPKNIFITRTGRVKLLDFGFSGQKNNQACTFPYLALEGWQGGPLTWESDLYSLGLLKREMETGSMALDCDQARQRAENLKETNSLLREIPIERSFLALTSTGPLRGHLAEMVQQIQQSKKKSFFQQTMLIHPRKARREVFVLLRSLLPRSVRPLILALVCLFSQTLHPADLHSFAKSSKVWKLEVRSLRWAQVTLFHIRPHKTVLVHQQYTPFLQAHLTPGRYQLRWQSQNQTGLISVQLNKNQRILLP